MGRIRDEVMVGKPPGYIAAPPARLEPLYALEKQLRKRAEDCLRRSEGTPNRAKAREWWKRSVLLSEIATVVSLARREI